MVWGVVSRKPLSASSYSATLALRRTATRAASAGAGRTASERRTARARRSGCRRTWSPDQPTFFLTLDLILARNNERPDTLGWPPCVVSRDPAGPEQPESALSAIVPDAMRAGQMRGN